MKTRKVAIADGETPFMVPAQRFAIGPAAEGGYTVHVSVDGETFVETDVEASAGDIKVVDAYPAGMYYKLDGNAGQLRLLYEEED